MSKAKIQHAVQQALQKKPLHDRIQRISLFGSQLHGNARKDSDVDLLIEFRQPTGYFELVRIQDELTRALHRPVDLVTPGALSKYFRSEVLSEAELLYER